MNDQKIIIVEDEDKIAQILVDYLAKEGFKTIVLNDGSNAVETIKASDPVIRHTGSHVAGKRRLEHLQGSQAVFHGADSHAHRQGRRNRPPARSGNRG